MNQLENTAHVSVHRRSKNVPERIGHCTSRRIQPRSTSLISRLAVIGWSFDQSFDEHGIIRESGNAYRSIASVLYLQLVGRVSPIDSCCERSSRLYRR